MSNLGPKIIELHAQGTTRPEICRILNCTKSTVSYHLSDGQKAKTRLRTIKRRKSHPYIKKLENFKEVYAKPHDKNFFHKWRALMALKIQKFHTNKKTHIMEDKTFTVQEVIDKFGENPICYLTGDKINIYEPRTYSFDHIVPSSRGGTNTLENLGICTKVANQAKSNLMLDEFYELCKRIIEQKEKSSKE